jgi:hypothetical protein
MIFKKIVKGETLEKPPLRGGREAPTIRFKSTETSLD